MKSKVSHIFFGFLAMGAVVGINGPLVQLASEHISIQKQTIGYILSTQFVGSLSAIIFAIFSIEKLGKIRLTNIGGILMTTSVILPILHPSVPSLYFFSFLTGIGLGLFSASYMALGLDYANRFPVQKRAAKNILFHLFFGIGAILGPLVASLSSSLLGNWIFTYPLFALFPIACLLSIFRVVEIPKEAHDQNIPTLSREHILSFPFLILMLSGFAYIGVEGTVFAWIAMYWNENVEAWESFKPAYSASIYWTLFMVGRIVLPRFIEKTGTYAFTRNATIATFFVALFWSVSGSNAWVVLLAISSIGLLLSCLYPNILVLVDVRYPGNTGKVSSIFTFCTSIAAISFPIVIGTLTNHNGMDILPYILLASSTLMLVAVLLANRRNEVSSPKLPNFDT